MSLPALEAWISCWATRTDEYRQKAAAAGNESVCRFNFRIQAIQWFDGVA